MRICQFGPRLSFMALFLGTATSVTKQERRQMLFWSDDQNFSFTNTIENKLHFICFIDICSSPCPSSATMEMRSTFRSTVRIGAARTKKHPSVLHHPQKQGG